MPDFSLRFIHAVILPSAWHAVNVNALFFFQINKFAHYVRYETLAQFGTILAQ